MVGGARGGAYRAAHGHIMARYWSRHATWNVACALSGKVTVTASPCTGWVHHAQDRTGCACLRRGRLTFAMLRPFLHPAVGTFPHARHRERLPDTPGACSRSLGSASGRPGAAKSPVTLGRMAYPSWWTGECSMKEWDMTEDPQQPPTAEVRPCTPPHLSAVQCGVGDEAVFGPTPHICHAPHMRGVGYKTPCSGGAWRSRRQVPGHADYRGTRLGVGSAGSGWASISRARFSKIGRAHV